MNTVFIILLIGIVNAMLLALIYICSILPYRDTIKCSKNELAEVFSNLPDNATVYIFVGRNTYGKHRNN